MTNTEEMCRVSMVNFQFTVTIQIMHTSSSGALLAKDNYERLLLFRSSKQEIT